MTWGIVWELLTAWTAAGAGRDRRTGKMDTAITMEAKSADKWAFSFQLGLTNALIYITSLH